MQRSAKNIRGWLRHHRASQRTWPPPELGKGQTAKQSAKPSTGKRSLVRDGSPLDMAMRAVGDVSRVTLTRCRNRKSYVYLSSTAAVIWPPARASDIRPSSLQPRWAYDIATSVASGWKRSNLGDCAAAIERPFELATHKRSMHPVIYEGWTTLETAEGSDRPYDDYWVQAS